MAPWPPNTTAPPPAGVRAAGWAHQPPWPCGCGSCAGSGALGPAVKPTWSLRLARLRFVAGPCAAPPAISHAPTPRLLFASRVRRRSPALGHLSAARCLLSCVRGYAAASCRGLLVLRSVCSWEIRSTTGLGFLSSFIIVIP